MLQEQQCTERGESLSQPGIQPNCMKILCTNLNIVIDIILRGMMGTLFLCCILKQKNQQKQKDILYELLSLQEKNAFLIKHVN